MSRPVARLAGLVVALPLVAQAVASDRLAVEVLPGETVQEAALSYERACYRLGAQVSSVHPVQPFTHRGARYVRLFVDGSPFALRCLSELEPGRRAVDGTIEWFDGFRGGLLVPSPGEDDRLPDGEWYDPDALPPEPRADDALVARLGAGDLEALDELDRRPLEEALVEVDALAARADAKALATLELVARRHPHWRVRRAALGTLDATVSTAAIIELARNDPAWEVRHGAIEQLGLLAGSLGLPGLPSAVAPEELLVEVARGDPAWEVRRAALWQLSSAAAARNQAPLEQLAATDAEPRVRAAALETLAGAGLASRLLLRRAFADPAAPVRMSAAGALVRLLERGDLPALWSAMNAPERGVRLAAAPLLDRLDDRTIGPLVWTLYLREAEETDADTEYLRTLATYLARLPFPSLAATAGLRLDQPISPAEKRVLTTLYATLAPAEAAARLTPLLASPDAALRGVAAESTPSSAAVATRRIALLQDEEPDVRAAALLGLCRLDGGAPPEVLALADLVPMGLGQEALHVRQTCGAPEARPVRFATALEGRLDDDAAPAGAGRGAWPAAVGMLLLFVSVLGLKLTGSTGPVRPTRPPDGPGPT